MQETNFENNVQQEMLGFRVKPSEEVWLKVEERIRKKKRRRIFFILFFAGLALLGYWQRDVLFDEHKSGLSEPVSLQQDNKSATDTTKIITPAHVTDKLVLDNSKETGSGILKNDIKAIDPPKEKILTVKKQKQSEKPSVSVLAKENQDDEKSSSVQTKSLINLPDKTQITGDDSTVDTETIAITKTEVAQRDDKVVVIEKRDSVVAGETVPMVENKVQIDSTVKPDTIADTVGATKKQPAIVKKWKWGVQVMPGVSSFVNHAFSFSLNKSADLASSPAGGAPVPPAKPSVRKSGFGLKIGGVAEREISSKIKISLGLQYSYYSDHIQVGGNRDSILNNSQQLFALQDASRVYGAANSKNNYRNHYHFLELPVENNIRLNKNPARPVYLNFGFTLGHLVSTNALVYDTVFGGIYFDGKNQLNKTQFSLSSGLSWTIPSKKINWSIGPVINFHLNRFLKNSFEEEKYLLVPGIRAKIIFRDK